MFAAKIREKEKREEQVLEARWLGPGSQVSAEVVLVLRVPARVSSSLSNDDGRFTKTSDPAR